jgi:AcrR family transcriptional regulator
MSVRDKVLQAAERLAAAKPFDQITFAEIAEEAGVHWTAVRRHFGDKLGMRSWLQEKQSADSGQLTDTRTRILDAATRVFAEQGYANASLEKVAAAAGMTKGAVYWHFASKQDLFLAIIERNLSQQLRQLPGQIEQMLVNNDPEAALANWLKSQFDCLEAGEGGAMLFLEFVTSSREPEVREKLQTLYGRSIDAIGAFLTEVQRKGYMADGFDPQYVGILVDALLKGIVIEWLIDPTRCRLEPLLDNAARMLWRGLAPRINA